MQVGAIVPETVLLVANLGDPALADQSYLGAFDEVYTYSRVLSTSEILAAYNQGIAAGFLFGHYLHDYEPMLHR